MVEIRGLIRKFGDFVAVNNLHLQVFQGTIFGFLGPNGAGKSTTVKMLTGILKPSAGEALIDGLSIRTSPVAVKQRIGVLPEDLALFVCASCVRGMSADIVTPFILSVFARWKSLDLPADLSVAEGYQPLLENLTAQANDNFEIAVVKACDSHLSQFESNEFAKSVEVVFPVEILFVMRVREILGLQNPNVDHPLLNSSLGRLPAMGCSMNPLLQPVHERIQREFSFDG